MNRPIAVPHGSSCTADPAATDVPVTAALFQGGRFVHRIRAAVNRSGKVTIVSSITSISSPQVTVNDDTARRC